MIGTVVAIAIVFAILLIVTRAVAYYRGEFSVVGAERSRETGVGQPAAVGAGAGLIVLVLLALLYVGVTRWEWFGATAPRPAPVSVPAKESPPPVLGGIGATPSAPPAGASPSASPT